jgi:hypothetical protein
LKVTSGRELKPPRSQKPETPDLSGIWQTDEGEEVEVPAELSGRFGSLVATFTEHNKRPLGDCPFEQGRRSKYIEGKISGNVLTGTMYRCTNVEVLATKCKLGVFSTTITATVTKDKIIGTRRSEWYKPTEGDECKFTRDKSGDKDIPFSMTRKTKNHCPDTEEIEKYNAVSERAAKFTELAAKFVKNKDSQMSQALDDSQKALRGISNGLNVYITLGEKCNEIRDVLGDLEEFQNAIDQINNAGCDSSVLARGFDDLFRSAGTLGKRFVKLPALTPMFEILSQNQNFFVKVSGALNPEQRWANQFSGIDGYVPNCH